MVIVTHDAKAASYADRVIFLADGKLVNELENPMLLPPEHVLSAFHAEAKFRQIHLMFSSWDHGRSECSVSCSMLVSRHRKTSP